MSIKVYYCSTFESYLEEGWFGSKSSLDVIMWLLNVNTRSFSQEQNVQKSKCLSSLNMSYFTMMEIQVTTT